MSTQTQQIYVYGEDKTAELRGFAESIGLNHHASGRYSTLFLIDLFALFLDNHNVFKVLDEIEALDNPERVSRTKPAEAFSGSILKGLWHKHYLRSGIPSLVKNIRLGLGRQGIERVLDSHIKDGEELTHERIAAFTDDLVHGTYSRRAEASKLTGEWIIFAKHEGQNYYLALGSHDSGDAQIADRIKRICLKEFPFLGYLFSDPP